MSTSYMTQSELDMLTANSMYWVASRTVQFATSYSMYGLFRVLNNSVGYGSMFFSSGGDYANQYAVRPVVSINLDSYNIVASGTGTDSTTAWRVEKK